MFAGCELLGGTRGAIMGTDGGDYEACAGGRLAVENMSSLVGSRFELVLITRNPQ